MTPSAAAPGPTGCRPLWIPSGVAWESLPEAVRLAVTEVVNPAYEQLVLGAADGLERSVGMTYVHMLWLEVLEQVGLGEDMRGQLPRGDAADGYAETLGRYLRLAGAKGRYGEFLLKLRRLRDKQGPAWAQAPADPGPSCRGPL